MSVSDTLFKTCEDVELEDLLEGKMDILSTMLVNGAQPTLAALRMLFRKSPEQVEELLEYLRDMPLYDSVEVNGVTYLLVHAGLGNFSTNRKLASYCSFAECGL